MSVVVPDVGGKMVNSDVENSENELCFPRVLRNYVEGMGWDGFQF